MIREAAAAGADAVKFQCYRPHFMTAEAFEYQKAVLMSTNAPHFDDWLRGAKVHPEAEILNRIALTEPDIRYLYWRCQQHGIEFLCTPMYPEAVAMLNPYVKRWKVRYADQGNKEIITEVIKTEKMILVSTDTHWDDALTPKGQVRTLFCVPEYPPKGLMIGDGTHYNGIEGLEKYDGFSSHFPCLEIPVNTVKKNNLCFLEVHVRLDKYDPAWCPIDQRVSITMSELRQLCKELGK